MKKETSFELRIFMHLVDIQWNGVLVSRTMNTEDAEKCVKMRTKPKRIFYFDSILHSALGGRYMRKYPNEHRICCVWMLNQLNVMNVCKIVNHEVVNEMPDIKQWTVNMKTIFTNEHWTWKKIYARRGEAFAQIYCNERLCVFLFYFFIFYTFFALKSVG